MSRKNTPPSYTDPGGPNIVDTHSYRLSPFGPALQFGGGSNVISANSFCNLLALDVSPLGDFESHSFDADAISLALFSLVSPLHLVLVAGVVVFSVSDDPFVDAVVVDDEDPDDDVVPLVASPAPPCPFVVSSFFATFSSLASQLAAEVGRGVTVVAVDADIMLLGV